MKELRQALRITVGGLLVFTAGMWVFVFSVILKYGELTLFEPSIIIRWAELILAALMAAVGVVSFILGIKGCE